MQREGKAEGGAGQMENGKWKMENGKKAAA